MKNAICHKLKKKIENMGLDANLPTNLKVFDLTDKHYRRFYPDELENDKKLFPRMPFYKFKIKRGANRGNKSSGMLSMFGMGDKKDESGQVSTIKEVGFFKGTIHIDSITERIAFFNFQKAMIKEIEKLIVRIHEEEHPGHEYKFSIKRLNKISERHKLEKMLKHVGCEIDGMVEFFEDLAFQDVIKHQLSVKTNCHVHVYVLEGSELA